MRNGHGGSPKLAFDLRPDDHEILAALRVATGLTSNTEICRLALRVLYRHELGERFWVAQGKDLMARTGT